MKRLTDQIYGAVQNEISHEALSAIYGEPVEVMSGIVRHFIHAPGFQMIDADYNAIEARIICWLAGEEKILDMWRGGRDLYRYMASLVYARREDEIQKGSEERDMGKRIELGCGYGMGPAKFLATCQQFGAQCDAMLAERCVEVYRESHPNVVKYWYQLDGQCREAIEKPGTTVGPFRVLTLAGMPYLLFKLRSGRTLAYPKPMLEVDMQDARGRTQISCLGPAARQHPDGADQAVRRQAGGEWRRQATAADIMSNGALTAEQAGYEIFMLVHDQALCLKGEGQSADQFAGCLATVPPWAKGLPLAIRN
jgi:DNA polymerase